MAAFILHLGDCIDVMRTLADASVDAIVTDPPYHLTTGKKGGNGPASANLNTPAGRARVNTGFMGQQWDGGDIAQRVELWAECLRVLKPGGHLLAFAGSRTYHRMVCAIEDAGFEVRDQIMWLYGSGFPKSMDVSKAIDKAAGAEREVLGIAGKTGSGRSCMNDAPGNGRSRDYLAGEYLATAPATDAARQWDGWGTALKPAHEPICVARKPLTGTVAANVLAHGTGALNIDACRIPLNGDYKCKPNGRPSQTGLSDNYDPAAANQPDSLGRWPANIVHDGSDEVLAGFPAQAGARAPVHTRNGDKFRNSYGAFAGNIDEAGSTFQGDSGSAARFFYCAKASRTDRNEGCEGMPPQPGPESGGSRTLDAGKHGGYGAPRENHHPTVKPVSLMQWLVRLVTPPGGVVLDPFMGSGSTGKACVREGFRFIGIELSADYLTIAEARIAHEQARVAAASVPPQQPDLFRGRA